MPSTYTVAGGDTLSGIGAKYGLNYAQSLAGISGYKSGNANLIYPGEVLTINSGGPAAPSSTPAAATPTAPAAASPGNFATPSYDFVQKQLDEQKKTADTAKVASQTALQKLQDYYAGLTTSTEKFNTLNKQQGVAEQSALVDTLTKNVMSTEDQIQATNDSVKQRSKDFLINDAERTAITNREQQPLMDTLTKLLRSKQYEEVGLAGKQNLVRELLNLSVQDDAQKAKPLQLGVDYTQKDYDTAQSIVGDLIGKASSAYSNDVSAYNDKQKSAQDFANSIALENLKSQNTINEKNKTGSGTTSTVNKQTQAALSKVESIVTKAGSGKSSQKQAKSDIWNYIHTVVEPNAKATGVDTQALWKIYNSL